MTDEQRNDEAVLPEDAVEDLAPEGEEQDVKGGALYMKYAATDGPTEASQKVDVSSFQWGVG
jgi:hypothetical protein